MSPHRLDPQPPPRNLRATHLQKAQTFTSNHFHNLRSARSEQFVERDVWGPGHGQLFLIFTQRRKQGQPQGNKKVKIPAFVSRPRETAQDLRRF